jgi:hypothetical protein
LVKAVWFFRFFYATFALVKVATFRLGSLRFGLVFGLGLEPFCGLRLLVWAVATFARGR